MWIKSTEYGWEIKRRKNRRLVQDRCIIKKIRNNEFLNERVNRHGGVRRCNWWNELIFIKLGF